MEIQRREAFRRYSEGLSLAGAGHPEFPEEEREALALAYTTGRLGVATCFLLDEGGLPVARDGLAAMRLQ